MFTGLEKVVAPKGVSIDVNLTSWREIAHSLRVLAATFEGFQEREFSFSSGSVGRVEAGDGSSCGGWIVKDKS